MTIVEILSHLGTFILFINTVLCIKSFSLKRRRAFNIMSVYLTVTFTIIIITSYYQSKGMNNLFLSHFYFVCQFMFLSFFFKNLLINKTQRKIINIILVGVVITILFQYLYKPNLFYKFNLFEIVLTSVPLIMYSIVHFYNMLGKEKEYLYINSGVFLYLTGSTLLFVAGNYIVSSNSVLNKSIWIINSVLFIVYQILIFIEWRKSFYQKKIQ
ncbi:hypothetical protein D1818_24900 [Aquimarina sp. BL5]|nr:hypothetical protein D1818_24900 [Aquimarina sp. BL5]